MVKKLITHQKWKTGKALDGGTYDENTKTHDGTSHYSIS